MLRPMPPHGARTACTSSYLANEPCFRVAARYRHHLTDARTFQAITMEEAVGVLRVTCGAPWVESFFRRYLDYSRAAREQ